MEAMAGGGRMEVERRVRDRDRVVRLVLMEWRRGDDCFDDRDDDDAMSSLSLLFDNICIIVFIVGADGSCFVDDKEIHFLLL